MGNTCAHISRNSQYYHEQGMTQLDDETIEEIYQAYELIPDVDHDEEVSVKDMILNLCFAYPDVLTQVQEYEETVTSLQQTIQTLNEENDQLAED